MKKLLLISALLLSTPATAADLNLGMQALAKNDYTTAISNLQPLAIEGNPEAAYRMCGLYYLGQGVTKSDVEAVHYCRIAADRGHADAQYNLGLFYQQGTGTNRDLTEATRWYNAAAGAGHPDAKFNLAQLQATTISPAAVSAAAAGAPPASAPPSTWLPAGTKAQVVEETIAKQEAVALASATPPPPVMPTPPVAVAAPVPPPIPPLPPVPPAVQNQLNAAPAAPAPAAPEEAAPIDINKYCLMAAQRGNPDPKCSKEYSNYLPEEPKPPVAPVAPAAPVSVAAPVEQAKPVAPTPPAPPSPAVAKTLAKQPGYLDAPKSVAASAKSTASAAANAIPVEDISSTLVVNTTAPAAPIPASALPAIVPDPNKEPPLKHQNLDWFIKQASAGNSEAQNYLGVMHRRGINGAAKDAKEAVRWFEHSASRGDTNAMMNLASMYKEGEGTKKNTELAYAWYNLAADRLPAGEAKNRATENVQALAKQLNNQQIGSALQYVTKLDEAIPVKE